MTKASVLLELISYVERSFVITNRKTSCLNVLKWLVYQLSPYTPPPSSGIGGYQDLNSYS